MGSINLKYIKYMDNKITINNLIESNIKKLFIKYIRGYIDNIKNIIHIILNNIFFNPIFIGKALLPKYREIIMLKIFEIIVAIIAPNTPYAGIINIFKKIFNPSEKIEIGRL